MNRTKYWDEELKPFLTELHKKFDAVDKLSRYYLGASMYYIEHELADGSDPRFRAIQIEGVFNEKSFQDIKEFADFKDDIAKAGKMLSKFISCDT